jgi:MbtH protein
MDAIAEFHVVRNDEEQYSIWPADRPPPAGWHRAGMTGEREQCLAYIDQVWTDLRPASLRRASEAAAGGDE